jgi:hypothetical protein
MNPRTAALTLWALDTGERVVKTFLVGWLGAWLAIQDQRLDQLFATDTLTAGVVAAVGSLTLALGARQLGSRASASWLPGVIPEIPEQIALTAGNVRAFDGGHLAARRELPARTNGR